MALFKDNFLLVLLLASVTVHEHSNASREAEMPSNRLQEINRPDASAPLRTRSVPVTPQVKAASRFWYTVKGEADHFREESRDENGVVHGTYGYRTPTGIMRLVRYVADAKGFRAGISSNEPGVSQMEPSSVRLHKFSAPRPQRTQPNSRIRNPPLNFVSSPVRTHLWGPNSAEFTPFKYGANSYKDTIRYAPEIPFALRPRRNNIQRTKQTRPFGSATKNTFFSSVNRKDVMYGTRNLHRSNPKFYNARTTPIKITTPPTEPFDPSRLPPWKRISLVKKNIGAINTGDSADSFAKSDEHIVSGNVLKENEEAIKEPASNCGKMCTSKLTSSLQLGLKNIGKETSTNSFVSHSGFHEEHLSHSFSIQEKLSAVRTILRDYLSKDNTTLPQLVFAKKLLQFYDLNGIVPPHLLPNSISVPSHLKRNDAEVKALLDQIAEERWQYERNQQRYKKPWTSENGLREIYQPEYSLPFQYPKKPFIQVLSPIAVDILGNVLYEKTSTDRDSVKASSGSGVTNVNKGEHGEVQFDSTVSHSSPVEGVTNNSQVTEHVSTLGDKDDSLRQFVLRHFLLGKYASDKGIKSQKDNNGENFMSNNGALSSLTGSTEKEILNHPVNNIEISETPHELTTQENATSLSKESHLDGETESQLSRCSENSHDCITKTEIPDSEERTDSLAQKDVENTSPVLPEHSSIEYLETDSPELTQYPDTASTVSRYWQDNSFLHRHSPRGDHRLFKITRPERPVYDSRGQLVKPDAVPLHLHRFMPVKSSSPSSLGPFRFSIPRPVPPSSVIIPPKPPTAF